VACVAVCRKEDDKPSSDLLDEHDKWFNLGVNQKPDNYLEELVCVCVCERNSVYCFSLVFTLLKQQDVLSTCHYTPRLVWLDFESINTTLTCP